MPVKFKRANASKLAIRVTAGQDHMIRYMQTRNEVVQYQDLDPVDMSDDQRRLYNQCVYIPVAEATQVSSFLKNAEFTNHLGANSFLWIQGDAGTGKTSLALEASARHLYPHNVGESASRPRMDKGVVYDYAPICCISGQGSQIAGLVRSGCTWFGLDAPKSGSEAGDRLGGIVHECGTRIIVVDDLHGLMHIHKSIDEFRVALNKLAATVIFISVNRKDMVKASVAAALMDETPAGKQILSRTTPLVLRNVHDMSEEEVKDSIKMALGSFKLTGKCSDADAISQWILHESRSNPRLASLPLIYTMLRSLAAGAVGEEESITLPRVIAAA